MKWPETQAIFHALNNNRDFENSDALFVGGCVRNAVLGKPVRDIDLATVLRPASVISALKDANIRHIPTGIEHGTVTAVIGDRSFEITTLRRDVETDGRHAVVSFSENWEEDAARRDFTMNTLLADLEGRIFDPTGRGIDDLEKRQVIFVGDPAQRIQEDYLRILRFFRFHAWYGSGSPDGEALGACAAFTEKLDTLSKERITQEFFKIIMADTVSDVLEYMQHTKTLPRVTGFTPAFLIEGRTKLFFRKFCAGQILSGIEDSEEDHALAARLVLLCDCDMQIFEGLRKHLVFPKRMLKICEVQNVLFQNDAIQKSYTNLRRIIYRHGRENALQLLLKECAREFSSENIEFSETQKEMIAYSRIWKIPEFPISGEDLIEKGYKPGPALGKKLKTIEEQWIDNDFKGLPKF